jgi:hypothetical protein
MNRPLPPVSHNLSLLALQLLLASTLLASPLLAKNEFPTGTYASGDFTIVLSSDGSFRVSEKAEMVVEGSYAVEQDRISLIDKQGRYACTAEGEGKYSWKQNGETLSFTKTDDGCPGRVRILTAQPLTRQKKQ